MKTNNHTHASRFFIIALCLLLTVNSCKSTKNNDSKITTSTAKNWAEKLGWPSGKKVIILHADDIGMCPEANIAAKEQLIHNEIQSAAIMMPCANAKDFIKWAISNPKKDIGLHLTLTSEWKKYRWGTLSKASEVPGLLDTEHNMWPSVSEVVEHATAQEVEKEVRKQIDDAIALGYTPDHIDTHMGTLYGDPAYVDVFLKVAQAYHIPANVIDLSNETVTNAFKTLGYPINDYVIDLTKKYKLPKLDNFTSVPKADTYEEKIEKFKALITDLKPGLTEIIFHPSVETENLKSITNSWQQRVWEAKMFGDPELKAFFKKEGIVFTNWKEMMHRFNNNK